MLADGVSTQLPSSPPLTLLWFKYNYLGEIISIFLPSLYPLAVVNILSQFDVFNIYFMIHIAFVSDR